MTHAMRAAVLALAAVCTHAQDGNGLTPAQRTIMETLFSLGLTDPAGKTFVEVQVPIRGEPRADHGVWRWGWLAPTGPGGVERVYFLEADDWIEAPPADKRRVPSIALVDRPPGGGTGEGRRSEGAFEWQRQLTSIPLAAHVAWLLRLGHADVATTLQARLPESLTSRFARPPTSLKEVVGIELGWAAFDQSVRAFLAGADSEALRHVERLAQRYPRELNEYGAGAALRTDLRRRTATPDRPPSPTEAPAELAAWPVERQVAWLVEQLEHCRLGHLEDLVRDSVSFDGDWRVAALVRIGDPAVPALIDAFERDERLLRVARSDDRFLMQIRPDPSGRPSGHRLCSVREAAHAAIVRILRTERFETADELRAYWMRLGPASLARRMYDVLRDPTRPPAAWLEAAGVLADLSPWRDPATHLPVPDPTGAEQPASVRAEVQTFAAPTAAEAIVAALDRHVATGLDEPEDRLDVVDGYLDALFALGDARVLPELTRRARAEGPLPVRVAYAYRCYHQGERGPLAELAGDFGAGRFPATSPMDGASLAYVIERLAASRSAEGNRALAALARPDHPEHGRLRRVLFHGDGTHAEEDACQSHPFCLDVLRVALDDATPTGQSFRRGKGRIEHNQGHGWGYGPIPDDLRGLELKAEASERTCDTVAERASELVLGIPPYHPLLADADARLTTIRRWVDLCRNDPVAIESWRRPVYAPRFPRLDRAATADDVLAGRAIYHQGGAGRPAPAEVVVPALAVRRTGGANRESGMLVQPELGPDGALYYGMIGGGSVERVRADQLEGVEPVPVASRSAIRRWRDGNVHRAVVVAIPGATPRPAGR